MSRLLPAAVLLPLLAGPAFAAPVEQVRDVPAFDRIEINGSLDAEIAVGGEQSVVIRADAELQDRIETNVRGDTLVIRMKGRFHNTGEMRALISVASLEALAINGSADATVQGLDSEDFAIEISGSGDVTAAGRSGICHFEIDGSGDIGARELACGDTEIEIDGSGDAELHVTGTLSVDVSGSGDVDVWGAPAVRKIDISGSGDFEVHG